MTAAMAAHINSSKTAGNLETRFALCALLKQGLRAESHRKLNLVHFQRKTPLRVTSSIDSFDNTITHDVVYGKH